MVKLTGPFMSVTARGKAFKVMVYSWWKGIAYGRMLVTPTNPQSGAQGDRRVMLGGLGRSVKYCQVDKVYTNFAAAVTPAGQSWISRYIEYIMETYFTSAATFIDEYDEYMAHPAKADWDTRGLALGLTTFDLAYRDMAHAFPWGMQLYMVAKYGTAQYLLDNTKFNAAPYTKALADWVDADIVLMVADFSV